MKKHLIAIVTMLTLSIACVQAAGQTHRHHPQVTPVGTATTPVAPTTTPDTTRQDEVEAFSDTTSNAYGQDSIISRTVVSHGRTVTINGVPLPDDVVDEMMKNVDGGSIMGVFMVLGILLIIFVISPLVIIGIIAFFIYKNRKQRMRLAEAALKNGQPIPDGFVNDTKREEGGDIRQRGIRQTCLGVGLMIFLGNTAGSVGLGIGALVTCIGIGNLLIARSQKKNEELNNRNADLNRDLSERDFI